MKKLCTKSGCKTLIDVSESRCDKHQRAKRGERVTGQFKRDANYYTNRWKALSANQKRKQPLCENCLAIGLVREGRIADHIKEARDKPELFWNPDNLQTLCWSCHTIKTNKERRKRAKGKYKGVDEF